MTRKRYCKLHMARAHREFAERNLNNLGAALKEYRGGGQRRKGSQVYFKNTPNYQSDWDEFCAMFGNRGVGVKAGSDRRSYEIRRVQRVLAKSKQSKSCRMP